MNRRRRTPVVAVLALAVSPLSPPWTESASAAPAPTSVQVEDGIAATLEWTDCEPQKITLSTEAPDNARPFPAAGEDVGGLHVTAFALEGGFATWTFAPSASICADLTLDGDEVALDYEPLRLRWNARRLVVRAGERTGVKSIAGFRVNSFSRSTVPTIGRARKYFGRPSALRDKSRTSCTAIWRDLGLQITFVDYGLGGACRRGYAQAAVVSDTTQWAIKVGSRPAVVETSQPGYLYERQRAATTDTDGWWSLAEQYFPFGDPGYYPSITAHADEADAIDRYELWIGAGGE